MQTHGNPSAVAPTPGKKAGWSAPWRFQHFSRRWEIIHYLAPAFKVSLAAGFVLSSAMAQPWEEPGIPTGLFRGSVPSFLEVVMTYRLHPSVPFRE